MSTEGVRVTSAPPARQVVFPRVGVVELDEIAAPEVGPGELLVRIRRVGICATDLHILDGHIGDPFPVVPGHEFVGDVAAIGAEAAVERGLVVGDRVSVEMLLPCTACARCREGRYNLCLRDDPSEPGFRGGQYGINIGRNRAPGLWGGYADLLIAPAAAIIHRLPDNIEWDVLALVEPLAVAFRAVARGRVEPGDSVVVVGPGPVGMLIAAAARTAGAGRVVMVGTRESRLRQHPRSASTRRFSRATTQLAHVRDALGGVDADVVIEIAGAPVAQQLGGVARTPRRTRRPRWRVRCGRPGRIPRRRSTYSPAKSTCCRRSSRRVATSPSIAAITRGDYPYGDLVTHRFPLEDVATALELVRSKQDNVMKAILVPHE